MEIPEKVQKIIKDIESLKIQGATSVAEACFSGITSFVAEYPERGKSFDAFMADVEKIGMLLVRARPNEPLARNGLKYLLKNFKLKYPAAQTVKEAQEGFSVVMKDFMNLLDEAKKKIVQAVIPEFSGFKGILTHCHSSTVENICKAIAGSRGDKGFSVVATETRPLYQGRITAKHLSEAGLDVKLIVDNGIISFLVGDWGVPIDAVFLGCDEIIFNGDVVNKVGSYSVALGAYHASKPVYVVGTILKLDLATIYDKPQIEMRESSEVWKDAPKGLKIINPAFEIVPHELITGFATEFGVIHPHDIEKAIGKNYDWIW